ncbi:MAG: serine/threonine-protein kinase [Gemmatimonadota bacterium]|jgi:serine/threonine protein kinase
MSDRIIADRYRLLREVGRGGMAMVFLAVDEKHHREVALKVLRPDLAAVVGSVRFLREIEITAVLNHPHILPLLDSGADDEVLYYVMPYVAGGSLRRLLAHVLPLEAVTRIVQEVASALDHAHARNVIHRDIKPENILFNEGLAVVADFGVARVVSGAREDRVTGAAPRMTGTGLSVGTLGYMSPEQALGAEDLGPQTDVYSLASVAYEMLLGETPSSWPGAEDVKLGRFSDLPDAHRARLDGYPGRVEQVLAKGLALRRQHRFPTTGELATALAAAAQPTARLSDEQVRRLLERAAELQAEAPASEPQATQLTMGAVEQVAAQVGIPPSHVRDAAKELESVGVGPQPSLPAHSETTAPARPRPGGAIGGDWRRLRGERWNQLVAVETVEGEVPESVFAGMVGEIQRRLGIAGHASIVAGTLTWSPAAPGENTRKIVIQVTSADGRTEVRIQEDLEIHGAQRAALPVGGLIGLAFFAATAHVLGVADPAIGLFIVAGAGTGVLGAIRAVTGFAATDRAPELEELAQSLADIGRAALPGAAADGEGDES